MGSPHATRPEGGRSGAGPSATRSSSSPATSARRCRWCRVRASRVLTRTNKPCKTDPVQGPTSSSATARYPTSERLDSSAHARTFGSLWCLWWRFFRIFRNSPLGAMLTVVLPHPSPRQVSSAARASLINLLAHGATSAPQSIGTGSVIGTGTGRADSRAEDAQPTGVEARRRRRHAHAREPDARPAARRPPVLVRWRLQPPRRPAQDGCGAPPQMHRHSPPNSRAHAPPNLSPQVRPVRSSSRRGSSVRVSPCR